MKRWTAVILAAALGVGQAHAQISLVDALDGEALVWSTGGDVAWAGQAEVNHDGGDAAQCGPVTQGQHGWLEATVSGPGVFSFWWKASSDSSSSWLYVYVDGAWQNTLGGVSDWGQQTFKLRSGVHVIRWQYAKNSGTAPGMDYSWVDQVIWSPGVPVITEEPISAALLGGETARVSVTAEGDAPLTYRWYGGESGNTNSPVTGTAGSGAAFTTPPLTVSTSYWVRITNSKGIADSRTARMLRGNEIFTLSDLQKVGSGTNGWTSAAGYLLMNDIDASATAGWDGSRGFDPIGKDSWIYNPDLGMYTRNAFTGVFDGRGHVIRRLTINRPGQNYVGLFGYVEEGAVIRNVGLSGVTITGGSYTGGLVGWNSGGYIRGCRVEGEISGVEYQIGGLVGYNFKMGMILECCVVGSVSGYVGIGGLVGYNDGTVQNSYAACGVTGQGCSGLVYSQGSRGTISSSYWDTEVCGITWSGYGEEKTTMQMKQAATFTGWDFTNIWNIAEGLSYPYLKPFPPPFTLKVRVKGPGSVVAAPQQATYTPGSVVALEALTEAGQNEFMGWLGPVAAPRSPATTVTMASDVLATATFRPFRGLSTIMEVQLIGIDPDYPADGRYWLTQDIDASETAVWNDAGTDEATLEGFQPIVGFSGILDGNGHVIRGLTINRPTWHGVGLFTELGAKTAVLNLGLEGCAVFGGGEVGGLAGESSYGSVSLCYVTGIVTGSMSNVGGLVGYANGGYFSQCYAAAQVMAGQGNDGGLSGSGWVNGYACYWDTETSGQTDSGFGTGRTTAQMKQAATFVVWDFVGAWSIEEGLGYPRLQPFTTVLIHFQDGEGPALTEKSYTEGKPYDTLPIPARAGYSFGGWWTGPGGTGALVFPGSIVPAGGGVTLYAKWVLPLPLAEALDTATLTWVTGGDAAWFGLPSFSHDGVDAAQSGKMGSSGSTWLETEVTGPGQFSFWWRLSAEANDMPGHLVFAIDQGGEDQEAWIWGETEWSQGVFGIGPGTHKVRWTYMKDVADSDGFDCGWVDQAVWNKGAPVITDASQRAVVSSGRTTTLSVTAAGDAPLTYRWYGGECGDTNSPVAGAAGTGSAFTTPPVTGSTSYWVRVTNAKGSADSRSLQVTAAKEVYTLEDLQKVGSGTNGWTLEAGYLLMNDIDASETALWNDEDTEDELREGFKPIGAGYYEKTCYPNIKSTVFSGVFDGQGHVIRGLTINRREQGNVGLFANMGQGAIVRNVNLSEVSVTGDWTVGGLAGFVSGAAIADCRVTGCVSGLGSVGGLAAEIEGGSIQRCHVSGNVTGSENGDGGSGGLVAYCQDTDIRASTADVSVQGGWGVGCLAGYASESMIEGCIVKGSVTGYAELGGLAGSADDSRIYDCRFSGEVNGEDEAEDAGGLIGACWDLDIRRCQTGGSVSGEDGVGGLLGYCRRGNIQSCFASASVTGSEMTGGLIGYSRDTTNIACYASGVVAGDYESGGLVGYNRSGLVQACYSSSPVFGSEEVGGLVGTNGEGTVEASYWDTEASGQALSDGGEGRTTAQMRRSATFAGWDFATVWGQSEGLSYPYLRAFPAPFALTTITRGRGHVSATPGQAAYSAGAVVTVTALPDAGQNEFVRWLGPVADPAAASTTVTMDGHRSVVAVFRAFRGLATIEDLQLIGRDPLYPPDGRYWLTTNLDATVTAAWNDSGTDTAVCEGFMPIKGFSGLLDGNGHVISGLDIWRTNAWDVGLFQGLLAGAEVRNLGLVDCVVAGGGIVGPLASWNHGTVSRCFVTGVAVGVEVAGGLFGFNNGAVSECYAAVAITGEGGLIAVSDGNAVTEMSYWDRTLSGTGGSGGGAGRTTEEMRQAVTFAGWDFTTVWNIAEGVGYPFLRPSTTVVIGFSDPAGGSLPNRSFTAGRPYGELPEPKRTGYTFGGWWTGPDGTGVQVTPTTLAPDGVLTLYAKWSAVATPPPAVPVPYVCSPIIDATLTTTGSFDGYLFAASGFGGIATTAVRGTLALKITSLEGKLTAKATLQKAVLTFSASAWTASEADGSYRATLPGKGGEALVLFVRQDRVWGTLSGGSLGGESFTLDGGRNRFAEKSDAAAQTLLSDFKGYYTVALPVADALSLGAAEAAPQGSGYLTVTIGSGGSAKIAGVLADGTKVSQASRLILYGGCGPEACVPFFAPLYAAKTGWVGGLLWLDPETRTVMTDRDLGWFVRWEKPGAGADGFSLLLDADGGFYGSGAALAAGYLFTADAGSVPYYYADEMVDAVSEALPEGLAVANAGGKLTMAKGVKPVPVEGGYDYSGENSSLATLAFTSGTGLFKGKFNLYYDYDLNGKLTHKTVSVPYAGVLTPVRDAAFEGSPAGQGHCLIPDNDPALKAYKLKRSLPVQLEAE